VHPAEVEELSKLAYTFLIHSVRTNNFPNLPSTAKPQFSVPAFSEFPYLVNILSGPGQSPNKQCIIFPYLMNLDLENNPHLV
jgi:hypothetical protein